MNKWSLVMSLALSTTLMSIVAFIFSQAAEKGHYYFSTYAGQAIETLILVSIVQTTGMYAENQFQKKILGLLAAERRKVIELLATNRQLRKERGASDEQWD